MFFEQLNRISNQLNTEIQLCSTAWQKHLFFNDDWQNKLDSLLSAMNIIQNHIIQLYRTMTIQQKLQKSLLSFNKGFSDITKLSKQQDDFDVIQRTWLEQCFSVFKKETMALSNVLCSDLTHPSLDYPESNDVTKTVNNKNNLRLNYINSTPIIDNLTIPSTIGQVQTLCIHSNTLFTCDYLNKSIISMKIQTDDALTLSNDIHKVIQFQYEDNPWCVSLSTATPINYLFIGTVQGNLQCVNLTNKMIANVSKTLDNRTIWCIAVDPVDSSIWYSTYAHVFKLSQDRCDENNCDNSVVVYKRKQESLDKQYIMWLCVPKRGIRNNFYLLFGDKIRIINKETFITETVIGLQTLHCAEQMIVDDEQNFVVSNFSGKVITILNPVGSIIHNITVDGVVRGLELNMIRRSIFVLYDSSNNATQFIGIIKC